MKTEILTACDQLVSAAINGIGEGILLAVFVGCILRAMGPTNAATRHALWFFTLLLLVAIVPAHWWRDRLVSVHRTGIDRPPEKQANRLANSLPVPTSAEPRRSQTPLDVQVRVRGERSSAPPDDEKCGLQLAQSGPPDERLAADLRSRADGFLSPGSWDLDLGSAVPRLAGAVLVAVWVAAAAIKIPILLWRILGVRRLKKSSLPPSPELNELFRGLRAKLVMTRNVELRVSHVERSALVLGYFHPVILLPVEDGQPADLQAAEHVIGHELAHVHRFDDWANLIQHFIKAALFFHPAVCWVSNRLALEREIACDDFVLHQGGRPKQYALLLVNLAVRRNATQPLLAPGVSTEKCQLKQRINMILNAHRNTSPRLANGKLGFITTATALIALLTLYAAPRLVLAQNAAPAATADSAEGSSVSALAAAPEIAQADLPSSPGPATVEAGPKFKDGQPPSEDELPSPAVQREPRKPRPAAAPRLPRPPRGSGPDAIIEARLDRLERMVQSLVAQQKAKPAHPEISAKVFGHASPSPEANALAESKAAVKRQTARAAGMAKRATKQAEKAVKIEEESREMSSMQEGVQVQLQALHHAREALQREMEKLERHIEQIQREPEQTQEEKRERSEQDERQDDGPKRK